MWLSQRLEEEFPGIVMPALPVKMLVGKFDQTFVEVRESMCPFDVCENAGEVVDILTVFCSRFRYFWCVCFAFILVVERGNAPRRGIKGSLISVSVSGC